MCDLGYDENGCWLGNTCKSFCKDCVLDNCGTKHMECPTIDLGVGHIQLCSLPKIDGCEHTVEKLCPKSCDMGQSSCVSADENGCPSFKCSEGPECPKNNQILPGGYPIG